MSYLQALCRVCFCGLVAIAISGGVRAGETLQAGCSPWVPYVGAEMPDKGQLSAVVARAITEAGFEPEIVILPWKRVLREVEDGRIPIVFCTEHAEARSNWLYFTHKVLSSPTVAITLEGKEFSWDSLDDFKGKRIGLGLGYWYGAEVESRRGDLKVYEASTDVHLLEMLLKDRVDVIFIELNVAKWHFKMSFPDNADRFHIIAKPVVVQDFYLGVSKRYPGAEDISNRIRAAFERLNADNGEPIGDLTD